MYANDLKIYRKIRRASDAVKLQSDLYSLAEWTF